MPKRDVGTRAPPFDAADGAATAPAHPGGGGQCDQPAGGPVLPGAAGLPGRCGGQWPGSSCCRLRRQPYDVVLMDVQMPEMDGLEATRRIRELSPSELAAEAQPRIIAMTANAMKEDCDVCLAAGMDDYLSKPVQVEELVEALQQMPAAVKQQDPRKSDLPAATAKPRRCWIPSALERLRARLGKQADRMLPGLIDRFYQDADRLLGQARQALEQGQADDLRRASHSLKSTSATFGAMALSAVARELEYLARDGKLEGAAEQIAQAEAEFTRARAALEALQSEG